MGTSSASVLPVRFYNSNGRDIYWGIRGALSEEEVAFKNPGYNRQYVDGNPFMTSQRVLALADINYVYSFSRHGNSRRSLA